MGESVQEGLVDCDDQAGRESEEKAAEKEIEGGIEEEVEEPECVAESKEKLSAPREEDRRDSESLTLE